MRTRFPRAGARGYIPAPLRGGSVPAAICSGVEPDRRARKGVRLIFWARKRNLTPFLARCLRSCAYHARYASGRAYTGPLDERHQQETCLVNEGEMRLSSRGVFLCAAGREPPSRQYSDRPTPRLFSPDVVARSPMSATIGANDRRGSSRGSIVRSIRPRMSRSRDRWESRWRERLWSVAGAVHRADAY